MTEALRWLDCAEGRLDGARFVASPNCDDRPGGIKISLLVVHAISLPPGQFGSDAIEAFFTNSLDPDAHPYFREIADMKVSAHFLIRRTGEALQFVSCTRRAWHAGTSVWNGRERCNDFSIGIELEGCDQQNFELAQYETLNRLVAALHQRYPIEAIAAHSDIAPGRKSDPGPCFDWSLLSAR